MSTGRWDPVIELVKGAVGVGTTVKAQGPRVTVGVREGAGLRLMGARGIAPEHCTIETLGEREAYVTPIGSHPVRMSPSDGVQWTELEPLSQRTPLTPGSLIHLGPVGSSRGVTLRFRKCEPLRKIEPATSLGAWEERAPDGGISAQVNRLSVTTLAGRQHVSPLMWVVRGLWAGSVVMLLTAAVFWTVSRSQADRSFSTQGEDPLWVEVRERPPAFVLEGLQQPFVDFVLEPNRAVLESVAGVGSAAEVGALNPGSPEQWDRVLFEEFSKQVNALNKVPAFFHRLERVADSYHYVTQTLRSEGIPEVIAAVPLVESGYRPGPQSELCAKGYWQFMLEWGPYLTQGRGLDASWSVGSCSRYAQQGLWSPKDMAPPYNVAKNAEYVRGGACDIVRCARDFRTDLALSTAAAVLSFGDVLKDEPLAMSGAVTQIAVIAHHAGYDDAGKTGKPPRKYYNLDVAYARWSKDNQAKGRDVNPAHFYGDAMQCLGVPEDSETKCERYLPRLTQRYGVSVIARHALSVCYYGRYHRGKTAFAGWAPYVDGGYCDVLQLGLKAGG